MVRGTPCERRGSTCVVLADAEYVDGDDFAGALVRLLGVNGADRVVMSNVEQKDHIDIIAMCDGALRNREPESDRRNESTLRGVRKRIKSIDGDLVDLLRPLDDRSSSSV